MAKQNPDVFEELPDAIRPKLRHIAQGKNLAWYFTRMLSSTERKYVESSVAMTRPHDVDSAQGSLLNFLAYNSWKGAPVQTTANRLVLERAAPRKSEGFGVIFDDSGLLRQSKHSLSVQRQSTGSADSVTQCQAAGNSAFHTAREAIPIVIHLHVPKHCKEVNSPSDFVFMTKFEIALKILREDKDKDLPLGKIVHADTGYGYSPKLRSAVIGLGMWHAAGWQSILRVLDADTTLCETMSVGEPVKITPVKDFRRTIWREERESKKFPRRFNAIRGQVTTAPDEPTPKYSRQWLVIEWRNGESKPEYFYFCRLLTEGPASESYDRRRDAAHRENAQKLQESGWLRSLRWSFLA